MNNHSIYMAASSALPGTLGSEEPLARSALGLATLRWACTHQGLSKLTVSGRASTTSSLTASWVEAKINAMIMPTCICPLIPSNKVESNSKPATALSNAAITVLSDT